MSRRREFSAKVKVAAFERAANHCEECTAVLSVGRFHYDHIIPDALGGEPTLENCAVLCHACHGAKTAKKDVPQIAKAKRVARKHTGAHRPKSTIPGSKGHWLKRKLDGTTVRRNDDA
jgi:5-methylcytosine-specific restriction endonuclease McrA